MKGLINILFVILTVSINQPIIGQWTVLNSGTTEQLNSLFFLNADTGYVCGNEIILKTTNGGENWTTSLNDSSMHFKSIHFPSNEIGYAVSYYGKILKTINGGNSWETLPFDTTETCASIMFTSNDTGYIIGSYGMLLKTLDGGNTWTAKNLHWHDNLNSIYFVNNDTGYIIGAHKEVFITYDSGENWEAYSVSDYGWMMDIEFISDEIGFIAKDGLLLKSFNGGKNWATLLDCPSCYFRDIDFPDQNTGYLATGDSIYKSIDGGTTWKVQPGVFPDLILSFDFINKELGYAVGVNGVILKTTSGGFLSTEEHDNHSNIEVYPAPVNETLIIKNNSNITHGDLTISNLNGMTVFKSTFKLGINKFNISHLKPGIYIINLKSKSNRITRKLIKI